MSWYLRQVSRMTSGICTGGGVGGQAQRGNQGRVNPAAIAQSRLVTPCLQNGRDGGAADAEQLPLV
jgi:hypothetical protein